ncbi:signal peptidase I [Curtobacterium sp. MCSS17_008]|uniref:signal peptidase I n=1 Tax=Curtobacterium sp. MCSS17_008 TaxID=2175647 RepID=UPI000DA7EBA7|nr:signal peptidase I [Curtobacterium sp. MCSS17_008]PZF53288.1 signal peptidase I [Curtobacterium sp. MCSS17_008]
MSTAVARPARRRHPLVVLRGVLVTVAGVVGIICVIWWVIAATTGLSLIVVTTGSMSPTVPAGSVVVSERVPAASVRAGQVVTVPRPGASLPVTHRVVTVERVTGDTVARQFTLRGDANGTNDRDQYIVREAGLVIAAAPVLGSVLQAASTPAARGLAVAVVGLLVVWTFWPARRAPSDER